ncbi:UDP-glucose--hexose-1-phosphate uridylyltransferase [Microbulbifer sp. YPW1]|uniref:UDP-glucose--hexose-1-phosphate uridylyltransferase n=1 Tax=Microbulbifer sp. YPW1 TaxID=2745199 RepID=UPI00159AC9B6|nr:UDP-glucose--hexose-1-phosphate uridylyltransferase [Microbulbifer sp. YPW1]QKX17213.1 UDP-glucose--hexose-1-phosphate uridylyltransferase [Microbulbifer sp. YPW1]
MTPSYYNSDRHSAPHRRYNPLTGEYILVSPHRNQRPWQGQVDAPPPGETRAYVEDCYLCPGNGRSGGEYNPDYRGTFVFDNDFPALLDTADAPAASSEHPLLAQTPVRGQCRVICYSPQHHLSLAELPVQDIAGVVDTWANQYRELGQQFPWVQIFENKGAMMGCSSPHPHGQIWALDTLPTEAAKEDRHQREYLQKHGHSLLLEYAQLESEKGARTVVENPGWIAVVPHWAAWPFETLVLPKFSLQRLEQTTAEQRLQLADLLKRLLTRYDNLFQTRFPYTMGWHGAPYGPDAGDAGHWQFHGHFYPPLLRSHSVRKFMVGFEMLAEGQRDLTPELAAQMLRDCSEQHFSTSSE